MEQLSIDQLWEARFRGPPMPQECWLSYGGRRHIKIDRHKVQKSCRYFEILLNSTFLEGRQSIITLYLDGLVSFEAFALVVEYASRGFLRLDDDNLDVQSEALQLGILWGYEEFIRVLETNLTNQLSNDTILIIHALAKRHKPILKDLQKACEEFDETLVISLEYPLNWPTCPIDSHARHFAGYCASSRRPEQECQDIKEHIDRKKQMISSFYMSDDDKHKLAEFRDLKISKCRGTTRQWSHLTYKNTVPQSDDSVEQFIKALM